jgi:hypothetical protein
MPFFPANTIPFNPIRFRSLRSETVDPLQTTAAGFLFDNNEYSGYNTTSFESSAKSEVLYMSGTIAVLPGGQNKILFGGTRNEIKLSRPWQTSLDTLINPGKCPFCTKPQEELLLPVEAPKGWKLLPNIYTPHENHRLIVADHCWSAEELQRWGGKERITEALRIAQIANRTVSEETVLLIHVGSQAGQNLGHPHMHTLHALIDNSIGSIDFFSTTRDLETYVFETPDFIITAGGAKAGECHIVPKNPMYFNAKSLASSLAEALSRIIDLGNEKFRSVEGLAPPYGIAIRISAKGDLRYAVYCPTLHNQGVLECSIAVLEGAPYVIPWPHETTAAHLRK